ncbi:MAG: DUF1549 domain-containing protein, partial [Chthonomonadaceae bacterium]|nr:DUF1549 domain-containing protein [Chthonomonadaceae bacterium]
MRPAHIGVLILSVLACTPGLTVEGAPRDIPEAGRERAITFFESKVRPVLLNRCVSCHGEINQQGGLRLDSREALLKGGGRGPAIVPERPDQSLLVQVIRHEGELKMPPGGGQLRPDEIAAIVAWIRAGAVWPEKRPETTINPFAPERRNFWSFRPVKKPPVPAPSARPLKGAKSGNANSYASLWKHWVRTPIDAFILARLEAKGLRPAPEADRRTLIRRAYYDLLGLPPTPE